MHHSKNDELLPAILWICITTIYQTFSHLSKYIEIFGLFLLLRDSLYDPMIPGRLAPLGRAWFWVLGSTQRANCSGDWLRYLYIVRQQWLWVCQEGLWFIIDFSSFDVSVHFPWWINSQAEHLAVRKYHTALQSQSNNCWDHDHVEEWISVQVMVTCFNLQAETRISVLMFDASPPLLVSCCPYHHTIYSWSNPPKPVALEKSYYHCHYHSSFTETPPGDFV